MLPGSDKHIVAHLLVVCKALLLRRSLARGITWHVCAAIKAPQQGAIVNITKQFEATPITFNDDGWFNATEAAKAFDKRPNDWLALPSTIEYVGALRESDAGKSGIALVVTKKGGRAGTQGTWLHPKLGVAFARWLDVRFAVWCDTQIDAIIHGHQSIKDERASLRVEYRPMTDAVVRSRLDAGKEPAKHWHFSNEADLINRIALGYSAAAFRTHHEIGPDASLRDYLTPLQVRCLTDLQRANTVYLDDGLSFDDRKSKLTSLYQRRHCTALTEEQLRINA
jgi:hypothetical protein